MEQKFAYKGTTYSLDLDDELSVTEARYIKQHAGMSVGAWISGIQEGDVDAVCGMVFLAVRRAGGEIEWSDLDDMNLMELMESMIDENGLDREALARGESPLPQGQVELLNRAARRSEGKASSNGSGRPAPRRAAARK